MNADELTKLIDKKRADEDSHILIKGKDKRENDYNVLFCINDLFRKLGAEVGEARKDIENLKVFLDSFKSKSKKSTLTKEEVHALFEEKDPKVDAVFEEIKRRREARSNKN